MRAEGPWKKEQGFPSVGRSLWPEAGEITEVCGGRVRRSILVEAQRDPLKGSRSVLWVPDGDSGQGPVLDLGEKTADTPALVQRKPPGGADWKCTVLLPSTPWCDG